MAKWVHIDYEKMKVVVEDIEGHPEAIWTSIPDMVMSCEHGKWVMSSEKIFFWLRPVLITRESILLLDSRTGTFTKKHPKPSQMLRLTQELLCQTTTETYHKNCKCVKHFRKNDKTTQKQKKYFF